MTTLFFNKVVSEAAPVEMPVHAGTAVQMHMVALDPAAPRPAVLCFGSAHTEPAPVAWLDKERHPHAQLPHVFTADDSPLTLAVQGRGSVVVTGMYEQLPPDGEAGSGSDSEGSEDDEDMEEDDGEEEEVGAVVQAEEEEEEESEEESEEEVAPPPAPAREEKPKEKKRRAKAGPEEPPKRSRRDSDSDAGHAGASRDEPERGVSSRRLTGGVQVSDLSVGSGALVRKGGMVSIRYVGKIKHGAVFDQNRQAPKPFKFRIGANEVIRGMEIGVVGMRVGGTRIVTIPPKMGYGNRKNGPIPANSTLVFTIEVVKA